MKIRPHKGLTFDDVLLVPRRSPIASRGDVDTSTLLTPRIRLHVPVVSANMDTVTEAEMAIAMAQAGGMGILHRFMSVERQVQQVQRVKRSQGFIIENPYAIAPDAPLHQAQREMARRGVGGLVVTQPEPQGEQRLLGLLTNRDVLLAPDASAPVQQAMTPAERLVTAGPETSREEARRLLYEHRLEKLPVVDSRGRLVGLITARDVIKSRQTPDATTPHATVDEKDRLRVGAAIGVTAGERERAEALLAAGGDVLVLDIAHGHAEHCLRMLRELRTAFPDAQIIAGNVASKEGASELATAGADAVKVGIGPGSICTTRVVTGFGVPQLTAIMESAAGIRENGRHVPLIADGGIKRSGDLVKALAAGAESVMIGSLFAGCEEAPGAPVIRDGQKVKVVRGMASLGAAMGRRAAEKPPTDESAEDPEDWDKVVPEGVEAVVPYRGHVAEILHQLVGGLRSGLSYGGAHTIEELQQNAEFIEITPAGVRESGSHDVRRI